MDPTQKVRVLTRRLLPGNPWGARVELAQANVVNANSLIHATADVNVVVHCVRFPNYPIENPDKGWTYRKVEVEGTRNLIAACRRAGVDRFVYLSIAGADPERAEPWFRAKGVAERVVQESNIPSVILQPSSWVYGPGDRKLLRLFRLIRHLPFVPVIGDGRSRIRPVSVSDVVRMIAASVQRPAATGRVFQVGGPEELAIDEVLGVLQRLLGKNRSLVHIPASVAKTAAGFVSILPSSPWSPAAVDFMLSAVAIDPRPAERFLGRPFADLETEVRRILTTGKTHRRA